MPRVPKGVAAGMIAGAVWLGCAGRAAAQTATSTTTTVTTTTTTTTILPHPFSKATGACVHKVRRAYRACRRGGDAPCLPQFQADFPSCFAPGAAGVTCARRCVTREATCLGGTPTTRKSCRRTCATSRLADRRACKLIADGDNLWAGGDASCLANADATFDLCRFVCSEAVLDCHVALKFCIANCANQ